jgi:uncharacterized secreted protein with C-terminal beta-propeller domain
MIQRIVRILAILAISTAASAATVAERSPFAQGHWWNPARSGEGFDIFNAAGQIAVMWFTYDDTGRPVWYTAQGDDRSVGTAWPLLKHRWADGRKAGYTTVGTLRVDINHPESLRVSWQLGGFSGATNLEPFRASGVIGETDRTGSWFNPDNSGWGIAIVEQGEVLGGAVFTYDGSGEPTWVAGFGRDRSSVEYFSSRGSCPACPYVPPKLTSAGRLRFEFEGDRAGVVRNALTFPMANGVNMDGAKLVQLGRPASMRAADRQLASYESDADLRKYLVAGMLNVPSFGSGIDFSASPPPPVFSSTNLQEAGVDEPDVMKTDGRYVYTFGSGTASGAGPSIRVARVGDDVSALEVVANVPLTSGANTPMATFGLFLHEGDLVSITGTQPYAYMSPWASIGQWVRGTTNVEFLDVRTPERPASKWRIEMDGHLVGSRRIGDKLYLVTRFVPNLPGFLYGMSSGTPAFEANRQLLAGTPLSALMPAYRINGSATTPLVSSGHVYAPPQGARPPVADMVVITAIDLAQMRMTQSLAVLGSAETVYVSLSNLFLASSRYSLRTPAGVRVPEPPLFLTDVHQVRLGASEMSVVGSAAVEGHLGMDADMAMFRLSEFQGKLRVVTSSSIMWGPETRNRLTILEPSAIAPGLLRTVSYLPNASRPQSLGKPGELLYATRFVGERLYAVTFKKVDPLYIVDLVDVSDPRITGALEIPGFSDYLHPLPNGLLLGFGKDTVPAVSLGDGQFAWYQGLLLSLYDVSNAGAPREVQRVVMGKRGSDSALLRSHHAFSSLMRSDGTGVIALPASIHDGTPSYMSGDSTYYPWKESGLLRFELRGTSAANASLVQLPSLITHSVATTPGYFYDAATNSARSVLFPNGVVYVENGKFWRQDRDGQRFGPY